MARDAQKDPKGFYQLYRAKAKEVIEPLQGMDGSWIEKGEEIIYHTCHYYPRFQILSSRRIISITVLK